MLVIKSSVKTMAAGRRGLQGVVGELVVLQPLVCDEETSILRWSELSPLLSKYRLCVGGWKIPGSGAYSGLEQ